jgi:mycothiol maleylpyruvate isomerase-like protein
MRAILAMTAAVVATIHSLAYPARHTVRMSELSTKRDLMAEEDRLWAELHHLVDSLPPDKVTTPGYYAEGWSAKDLLAHIGSWLAEAGVVLERIRFGTYRSEEIDIDAMNQQFYETLKDVSIQTVRALASAARSRMLSAWGAVGDDSPDADMWIRKAGPEHYAEHLPRLREWVAELTRTSA